MPERLERIAQGTWGARRAIPGGEKDEAWWRTAGMPRVFSRALACINHLRGEDGTELVDLPSSFPGSWR